MLYKEARKWILCGLSNHISQRVWDEVMWVESLVKSFIKTNLSNLTINHLKIWPQDAAPSSKLLIKQKNTQDKAKPILYSIKDHSHPSNCPYVAYIHFHQSSSLFYVSNVGSPATITTSVQNVIDRLKVISVYNEAMLCCKIQQRQLIKLID